MYLGFRANTPKSIGFGKIHGVRTVNKTPVRVIRGQVSGLISFRTIGFTLSKRRAAAGVFVGAIATLGAVGVSQQPTFSPTQTAGASPAATTTTTTPEIQTANNVRTQTVETVQDHTLTISIPYANGETDFPAAGLTQVQDSIELITAGGGHNIEIDLFTGASDDFGSSFAASINVPNDQNIATAQLRELKAAAALLSDTELTGYGINQQSLDTDSDEVPFTPEQSWILHQLTNDFGYDSVDQVLSIYKYGDQESLPESITTLLGEAIDEARTAEVTIDFKTTTTVEAPAQEQTSAPIADVQTTSHEITPTITPTTSSSSKGFNPWALAAAATGVLPFLARKKRTRHGLTQDIVELDGDALEVDIHLDRSQTPSSLRKALKHYPVSQWHRVFAHRAATKIKEKIKGYNLYNLPSYSSTAIYQNLLRSNSIAAIEQVPVEGHGKVNIIFDSNLKDQVTMKTAQLAIKHALAEFPSTADQINGIILVAGDRSVPENTFFSPGLKTVVITINPDEKLQADPTLSDDIDNNVEYIFAIREAVRDMFLRVNDSVDAPVSVGKVKGRKGVFALAPRETYDLPSTIGTDSKFLNLLNGPTASNVPARLLDRDRFPGQHLSGITVPLISKVLVRS